MGRMNVLPVDITQRYTTPARPVATAMFVYIGTAPRSEMVDGLVLHDERGFIPAGPDVPRVLAAGHVGHR